MTVFRKQGDRHVATIEVRHELTAVDVVDVLRGASEVPAPSALSERGVLWAVVDAILTLEGTSAQHRGRALSGDDQWKALAAQVARLLPPERGLDIMQAMLGEQPTTEPAPTSGGHVEDTV